MKKDLNMTPVSTISQTQTMYINTLQMGSLTLNFISDDKQKKYYVIIKVRCSNGVAAPSHPTYGYIKNKLPVKIK